jgi:thiamine kinase
VIIDWEYAGVGNPWLDACMLYSACQVSADKISVLPAFASLSNEAFSQGLDQAVQVGQLLEQLWFRVRA